MHILTCPRKTPALHLNNTTNIALEEFQDEQSDLFKLKVMWKGKLKGIPIDPWLSQHTPEEPWEELEARPLPYPIPHPATPALPEEPMKPRPQPCCITPHAAPTSPPQDNLSLEPSHHTLSSPPPSNSPLMLPHPEEENPQLQVPPEECCPLPNSDTSSTSSQKWPNRSCTEGDKVPDASTGMVTRLNNLAFNGPLSPVASPGLKKKTHTKANVEPQTNTKTTGNKHMTCQQVKKSIISWTCIVTQGLVWKKWNGL